jgi:hypothetical protein
VPTPQVTVADAARATEVVEGMARVRAELGVANGFPADVLAAAETAARATARTSGRPDRTDIALVTIDPPGSRDLESAPAAEPLVLPREVGLLRQAAEAAGGGVSLPLPDQVVEPDGHHHYRLAYRAPLESEGWNAQISLLAGLEAPAP